MADNDKYIVSARKYRPSTFRSVVGQKTLTNTLKNAIDTGRLAQAYLFCGPRGVGKTSCARIFAKTINCLSPTADGEACGTCASCRAIDDGNSFNITELDAASNNGVDSIRSLNEQVNTPPQVGKYRVFIIDEVHMLSSGAFNAFLKTLEEPPAYVIFILATTEKHKVIPTILSRCQIYDFKRITIEDIADHLEYVAQQEGIKTERDALMTIARKADGGMRDALSIFDQVASSTRGNVTYAATIDNLNVLDYEYYFRLIDIFRKGDVPNAMLTYAEIRNKGFDSLYFINGLATHIRDLMLAASPSTLHLLEQSEEVAKRYQQQASGLPLEWYYTAMKLLNDCDQAYRTASEKRLLVELVLIRLCQLLKPATPPFDKVDELIPLQAIAPLAYQPTPQPQLQPQPAPAVRIESYIAPVSTPVSSRMGHTTSIRRNPNSQSPLPSSPASGQTQPAASQPSENAPQNRAYTPEEFEEACGEFIIHHPQYRIMNTALKREFPVYIGPDRYKAIASQPSEFSSFETDLRFLTEYVRARLGNSNIVIIPELQESETTHTPRLMGREYLAKVLETNHVLGDFLAKTGGEIL